MCLNGMGKKGERKAREGARRIKNWTEKESKREERREERKIDVAYS